MQAGNYILKYNCGMHIFLLDMQCLARVQPGLLTASISPGVGIFQGLMKILYSYWTCRMLGRRSGCGTTYLIALNC